MFDGVLASELNMCYNYKRILSFTLYERVFITKMKKNIISIIALILAMLTLLVSCNIQTNGGVEDQTTTEDSGSAQEPEQYPFMDMFKADLSQYVTLGDFMGISISMNMVPTDEEVDKAMDADVVYYDCYTLIKDRPTAAGDTLDIDFVGTMDGVEFEGGSAKNQKISLVENTGYIDGFDKDLYGVMPGTTVVTDVVFPEDYGMATLAGKAAQFSITVNGIRKYEYTDENVTNLTAGDYTTVAAFREYYVKTMTINNLKMYKNNLTSKIVKAIKECSTDILIPEAQINHYYYDEMSYYEAYYEQYASYLLYYYGIESYDDFLKYYGVDEELTLDNAKLSALEDILLISCAKSLGLDTLTDAEYEEGVKKYAEEWEYESADALKQNVKELVLRTFLVKDKVVDYLEANIEIDSNYNEYKHLLESESSGSEDTTAA